MNARNIFSFSLLIVVLGLVAIVLWANAEQLGLTSAPGTRPPTGAASRPAASRTAAASTQRQPEPKPIREFSGHTDGITAVAFSPDGKLLASASMDKTIRVWDVESGEEIKCLEGHVNGIYSIAFSQNGRRIISSGYDHTTLVWDWEKGEIAAKLDNKKNFDPRFAAFAENDRLALVTSDSEVVVWDIAQEEPVRELKAQSAIVRLAVSRDGHQALAATANCAVTLWNIADGQALATRSRPGQIVALSGGREEKDVNRIFGVTFLDDHRIAIADEFALWVWDRKQGDEVSFLRRCPSNSTFTSRDGALLARCTGQLSLEFVSASTQNLSVRTGPCQCAAFSDDYIAIGGGKDWWNTARPPVGPSKVQLFKLGELRERLEHRPARTNFSGEPDVSPEPPWTDADI